MSGTTVDPIASALARIKQSRKEPYVPMSSAERLKRIEAQRGEPTLADKIAEASEKANISAHGGG